MLERSPTDEALADTRLKPRRPPSLIAGFAHAARRAVEGRRPLTAAREKVGCFAGRYAARLTPAGAEVLSTWLRADKTRHNAEAQGVRSW